MSLKEKRTALQQHVQQTKTLYRKLAEQEKAHNEDPEKNPAPSGEERTQLNAMIEAGKTMRADLETAEELERQDELVNQPAGERRSREGQQEGKSQSWGRLTIASPEYKVARDLKEKSMDRVKIPAGARYLQRKAIYSGTDATGGVFTEPFRDSIVELPRRKRSVIDLVNVVEVSGDSFEYVVFNSRTNNAAVVEEFAGGVFGLKPQSDMDFALVEGLVKTIATWIPASRQILQDAPQLRDVIDSELTYMVELELEDQILTGPGGAGNLTGILNTAGIQTRVMDVSGAAMTGRDQAATDTVPDTIRRAITDIMLSFYEADGIVVNPIDAEKMELLKDGNDQYLRVYDPVSMRIWRVPVVETPAIPALTGLVGNFALGATLYDRQQTEILVGQPDDYFLRNAVAILAELRAGFAVKRPTAFEEITFDYS